MKRWIKFKRQEYYLNYRPLCRLLLLILVSFFPCGSCSQGFCESLSDTLLRQCCVLERYGHFSRLAALAERWASQRPRSLAAWRYKARALEELGRERGARDAWKSVLKLDTNHVEALCALATMDARRGNLKKAEAAIRRISLGDRNQSSVQTVEALLRYRAGNVTAAHQLIFQAMATASGTSVPWLVRADLLVEEGKLDEARRTLSALLVRRPNHSLVLSLRGMLRLREGLWEGAIDDLERALQIDPRHRKLYPLLIRSYESLGRLGEALSVARMGLELDPQNVHLSRLELILSERMTLASRGREERCGNLLLRWSPTMSEHRRRWVRRLLTLGVERIKRPYVLAGKKVPVEIRINFLAQAPQGMPAHYDYGIDELFVDENLFQGNNLESRKLAVHIILHELSHTFAFHACGQQAFARRALWLIEGLAEAQASGSKSKGSLINFSSNVKRRKVEHCERILDGLSRSLAVSTDVSGRLRRKAYNSAHRLIERLLRQTGSMEVLLGSLDNALRLYRRGESHKNVLKACWGVRIQSLLDL